MYHIYHHHYVYIYIYIIYLYLYLYREGRTTNCSSPVDFLALTANGGYAEKMVAGESCFVPVPDGWDAGNFIQCFCCVLS